MIKRTVNDIYKRTYNLNAEKGVQLRDFSHQKTWKSLMSDPRFKQRIKLQKGFDSFGKKDE